MRRMKRIIAFIVLLSVFILAGCTKADISPANTPDSTAIPKAETASETKQKETQMKNSEETPKYSFDKIPDGYSAPASKQGMLERFDYNVETENGNKISKYALVYLPYGYDAKDTDTQYNILYLIHGATGSPDTWFGGLDASTELKNVIDNMIERGDIEPLIVVTPTYYIEPASHPGEDDEQTKLFQAEFENYLMPLVEEKYHTYAKDTDKESLKASRAHRAFGGFSMGSGTTWYALMENIDYIEYFMPMCGDCWTYGMMGGGNHPDETAASLAKSVAESGYCSDEYNIYCSVGGSDMAYDPLTAMIEGMKKHTDVFIFADDFSDGNIRFDVAEGFEHDYPYANHYVYNALKLFFQSGE